jgi:hypothetical protein
MATLRVKSIAASCLGAGVPLSIRRDVFGYIWGPVNRTLSLRDHLERIAGTSINLSIFLVGHEPGFSGWFSQDDAGQIQHAVDVARELYAQVGLGVRRLYWRYIPPGEAGGYWAVDSGQATELTEAFSGPNDGIDVFYVNVVTDAGGWSNSGDGEGGPCDKDEKGERTGAVLEIKRPANDDKNQFAGILLAHEVGHYLGLQHAGDISNVMGDDSDGDGVGSISLSSVSLTTNQGNKMKSHCFVRPPCYLGEES